MTEALSRRSANLAGPRRFPRDHRELPRHRGVPPAVTQQPAHPGDQVRAEPHLVAGAEPSGPGRLHDRPGHVLGRDDAARAVGEYGLDDGVVFSLNAAYGPSPSGMRALGVSTKRVLTPVGWTKTTSTTKGLTS